MYGNLGAGSIPYYASTLVGRGAEIELLEELIRDSNVQLITVTGTAGVGKTRLAVHIARHMQDSSEDGALFVPLATVSDHSLVMAEIGKALGLQGGNLRDGIYSRLSTWRGVVVLDNFEQVIQAAPEIAAILPYNADLTLIITSQRPLQIDGERVVRLKPLELPERGGDPDTLRSAPSVQLLMDRARGQDVMLGETLDTASTTQAIAEICRRLDGIPLAIELAAPRLASLSPEVVLEQLMHGQQILSTQRRDTPQRQRTMHAAITWSFELLPEHSQRIFLWLGAFTAGFDFGIVQRLSRHLELRVQPVDTISELISLSLISRVSGGANPRYSMLESIRQFCLTELNHSDDRTAAQEFVADHVLCIADQTDATLTGPDSAEWMLRLDRELPTIRSSVAWALSHRDPFVPIRVASGMWRFLEQEGRWQEVVGWIDQAEEWRDKLPDEVLIAGMIAKMTLQEDGRDIPAALMTAAEVERLLRGKDLPELEVQYLLRSGSLAQDQQHLDDAHSFFQRALRLAERHRIVRNATVARANIGIIAYLRGDHASAESFFLQVRDDMEKLGDKPGVASMLSNLAATANLQNKPRRALEYLDQSVEIVQELGLKRDLIYSRLNQCAAYIALLELDAATDAAAEAIRLAQDLDYRVLESLGHSELAEILLLQENITGAATQILRALALLTPGEDARSYVDIGLLVADALGQSGRVADAAAVLARLLSFADEVEYTFEPQDEARIDRITCQIENKLENPNERQESSLAWTADEFISKLTWYSRRLAANLSGIIVKVVAPNTREGLTPRECEILQLLTEGHSTRSMADHLSVSPRTITTHIGNIMAKLQVSSRTELVAKAMRSGQH